VEQALPSDSMNIPAFSMHDLFDKQTCIGRMTNKLGMRVTIMEAPVEDEIYFYVIVNNKRIFESRNKEKAIYFAKWWMNCDTITDLRKESI
jgi:hypothetical protein